MDFLIGFFEGFTWQQLIAGIFFVLFAALPGFDFFNWIKVKLKLDGSKANLMVMIVSMLITAPVMYVTGALDVEGLQFTLKSILAFGSLIYTASQVAYQYFKNKMADVPPRLEDVQGLE